jgi:hypothetical protein
MIVTDRMYLPVFAELGIVEPLDAVSPPCSACDNTCGFSDG